MVTFKYLISILTICFLFLLGCESLNIKHLSKSIIEQYENSKGILEIELNNNDSICDDYLQLMLNHREEAFKMLFDTLNASEMYLPFVTNDEEKYFIRLRRNHLNTVLELLYFFNTPNEQIIIDSFYTHHPKSCLYLFEQNADILYNRFNYDLWWKLLKNNQSKLSKQDYYHDSITLRESIKTIPVFWKSDRSDLRKIKRD